jgi:hypothetical protein
MSTWEATKIFVEDFHKRIFFLLVCGQMKHFLQILANVRIGVAEVGGTLALIFIVAYATYKAWGDFVAPLFR